MNNKIIISVVGNGITAEILSRLLPDEFTVLKHYDYMPEKNEIVPFYSNDIKFGIMGEFLKAIDIKAESNSKGRKLNVKLLTDDGNLRFECSFWGLWNALLDKYDDDKESINNLFIGLRSVGEEWVEFFKNRFKDGKSIFKLSGKYGVKELKDIQSIFNIKNACISDLIGTLLPVNDVTISVFGGYLYSQLFDINCLDSNVFDFISNYSNAQKHLYPDITAIDIASLNSDYIIDCRASELDNSEFPSGMGSFTELSGAADTNMYYIKNDDFWIHAWQKNILTDADPNIWLFEYVIYNSLKTTEDVIAAFKKNISEGVDRLQIISQADLIRKYGFSVLSGFNWAFSRNKSIKDPMSIYGKSKNKIINGSIWGNAWFSSAFCSEKLIQELINSQ